MTTETGLPNLRDFQPRARFLGLETIQKAAPFFTVNLGSHSTSLRLKPTRTRSVNCLSVRAGRFLYVLQFYHGTFKTAEGIIRMKFRRWEEMRGRVNSLKRRHGVCRRSWR